MTKALLAAICMALFPAVTLAQSQVSFGGGGQDTSAPVEVTADSLSVNQADGTALYSGSVVIVQGEMRLAAPRVLVIYSDTRSEITRMEATGGVVMVRGEEAAEGERADYNIDDGQIVLSGNVLVTQGESAMTSERMVVNLDDGTAQMSGRVKTVLQQGGRDGGQ